MPTIVTIVLLLVAVLGGYLVVSHTRALARAQRTVRAATLRAEQHAQSLGRAEGFLRQAILTADPDTRVSLEIALHELDTDRRRLLEEQK